MRDLRSTFRASAISQERGMNAGIHWLYLLAAGLCEIGWPLGLKLSEDPAFRIWGPALSLVCLSVSAALLWLALKAIPIGTAYAVWTGIGAAAARRDGR